MINGRYCIALRNTYKRNYGVAQGASSSGRTVYVEPFAVIELTNELQELEAEYRREEENIFAHMTQMLLKYNEEVRGAVEAAARIDVLRAKCRVAERYDGVVPEVQEEGCVRCVKARHPLLALRGANGENALIIHACCESWTLACSLVTVSALWYA